MNSKYQPKLNIKSTLLKKLSDLEKKRKTLNTEIYNSVITELFIKYQLLQKFSFTAYTPYFNDGDACLYSVNYSWPRINDDDDDKVEDWRLHFVEDISYYFDFLHSDFFQDLFGDHVRITFYREDPTNPVVESCDHD